MKCAIHDCSKSSRNRGYCSAHYEKLRKYGDPLAMRQRRHHEGSPANGGYWHTMRGGIRKQEHVWVAEKALGKPMPAGAVVHHVDENPLNNTPTNLVICPSKAYHALIHVRMRALDECGHASWRKCWMCKTYDDPSKMAEVVRGRGSYFQHSACRNKRHAERQAARSEAR